MIGTYFYIIYFCYFIMFLVCVLQDVRNNFSSTAGVLYIILVGAEDIIMYSAAIIFITCSITIPILVGDLFYWVCFCVGVSELVLLLLLYR